MGHLSDSGHTTHVWIPLHDLRRRVHPTAILAALPVRAGVASAPTMGGAGPNDTKALLPGAVVADPLLLPPLEVVDGLAVEALPAALAHLLALQAWAAPTSSTNRRSRRDA